MTILFMTIPVTVLLVTFFIIIFLAAVRSEQFEDLETPSHAMLIEDEIEDIKNNKNEDTL